MRNVLMISRCFPPLLDVGGKRAYRFAKYLPAFGWRAIVWTSPIPCDHLVDPAPLELSEGHIERTYNPSWWPQPYLSYTVDRSPIAEAGEARRFVARLVSIPLGRDILLTPRALFRIGHLCRRERVEAIFATSGPYIALLNGWLASRLTGLPLCLDLRDPWSLNFLQQRKPSWVRAIEQRIERFLFQQANRVIFNSEDASRAYRALYPELPPNRITTITNSFDPVSQIKHQPLHGPLRLMHFGNCNGPRSLATVLRALAWMKDNNKWPSNGVRLLNFGKVRAHDLALADALGLSDIFECHAAIGSEQGVTSLAAADLQVLIGYGEETLYIPAKTFDYLLAARPVLCLSRPCELTKLIERTGAGRVVDPDDVVGTVTVIMAAVAARNEGPPVSVLNPDALSLYDARHTAAQLATILDEIVSEQASL